MKKCCVDNFRKEFRKVMFLCCNLKNPTRKPGMIGSDVGISGNEPSASATGRSVTHISMNSRNIPIGNTNQRAGDKKSTTISMGPSSAKPAGKFVFTSANVNQAATSAEKPSHSKNFS
jgi:hypothetical protein